MPLDGAVDDIEADFEILEAIGDHVDRLVERLVSSGALHRTLRRWLLGHAEPPDHGDEGECLLGLAADLELFTPSMSGRTMVGRHADSVRPASEVERRALEALAAARFRLVRVGGRANADLVRLEDLVTGENLLLLDARLSPQAVGALTAMRLCPLPSGREVLVSPLFTMDETMLASLPTFVRGGRLAGHGHRCAASLYRDVARRGWLPMPQLRPRAEAAVRDALGPTAMLAIRWMAIDDPGERAEVEREARQIAGVGGVVDACGFFCNASGADAPDGLKRSFERIAELQIETLAERARAGVAGWAAALDEAGHIIADEVARGRMAADAQRLFERLRLRATAPTEGRPMGAAASGDLERVIQLIRALRVRTVDRGCTEQEALAAAAKVAELLDRHDLTLDAVSVRDSACEGISIPTGRRRRAPIDTCMPGVAAFCDCRVWSETREDGGVGFVYFGLRADVEAARFLHETIEGAFEAETEAFRRGEIHQALRGGERRTAVTSFQAGLARGISDKLAALKAARGREPRPTGFDLVAAKRSVVDEEMARLGLVFTRRRTTRRLGDPAAYAAGEAAGALFEPHAPIGA